MEDLPVTLAIALSPPRDFRTRHRTATSGFGRWKGKLSDSLLSQMPRTSNLSAGKFSHGSEKRVPQRGAIAT